MYEIGSQVFENWTIQRRIGAGSFGAVYEIQREDFGETYRAALKVITVPQNDAEIDSLVAEGMSPEDIQRYYYSLVEELVREFAIMAKLKATGNIVSYEDHRVIRHSDGFGWDIQIRMELLTPLLNYAYQHPFARRDVIKLGIDMCRALELCQKYNIIHRDIKPENIFVSDNGDFKLGDFGIARSIERTMAGLSKKGTYSYMAPEVYTGGDYGFNVDIYSLGIVLYRLLNRNRTPFLPAPPEPLTARAREEALVRRLSGEQMPVPYYAQGRLGEIVLQACAYDPRARYFSPMQMRQELEAILYENSDASLIYPEGDKLAIQENRYVSQTPGTRTAAAGYDNRTQAAGGGQQYGGEQYGGRQHGQTREEEKLRRERQKRKGSGWIIVLLIVAILAAAGGFGFVYLQKQETAKQDEYATLLEKGQKYRAEDPDKALRYYKQAQELLPEEEAAYISYAYTLYLSGDYENCILYIEEDLALGKNYSEDGQSQLSEILGCAYFEQDDYAAAASFFRLSTAGRDLTVNAMRDYAVSLGRLGDIDAADEVLERMVDEGAEGDATTYVRGEIAYAQKVYVEAEELFREVLDTTADPALRRRSLRSLAEVYRDCAALEPAGQSPIQGAAMKEVELLNRGISAYGLQYDSTLREMLALAWYEAYFTDANATPDYLENAADSFRQVIDMGVEKPYLYRNLYTIYYELGDYDRAAAALDEYGEKFPRDHMSHALRGILLITIENGKAADSRDYSKAYAEYWEAEKLLTSSDDRTYFLQLESLIQQLKDNGWL